MQLSTDNVQATELQRLLSNFDVGTSASHIGRNGYPPNMPCFTDNGRLPLQVSCIQNIVFNVGVVQQFSKQLRFMP